MFIDKDLSTPLYMQIYENIKNMIENHELEENQKLSSIRSLADTLEVNNITVVNAYNLLEQEGYVYSIKGSGTYVSKSGYDITSSYIENEDIELMIGGILPISENTINFASASPTSNIFPVEEFKQSLIEVLDRDKGKAFEYPEIRGYEPFRESISSFLYENYTMEVHKDQVQIISGGQQGIDIISKTLISQGDCIFVENPTYSGAIAAFKSRGAKIIAIPMLEDGIDFEVLDKYIKKHKPKFLYMMSNYQSPTTHSYSQNKKEELLKLSEKYDFYIIEDDFLTDLSYSSEKNLPLKSIDSTDHVIYIKSFSKIFMPGVRIGFMTVPDNLFNHIVKVKHTTDISSSGFIQRAFDLYLRKGYWKDHMKTIKKVYTEKYNTMISELKALEKYNISFTEPDGGLSIWLKLPENIDAVDFYEECGKNNVAIVPGKIFFVNESIYNNYIRLSFGAVSDEEIIKGIGIMEKILSRIYNKSHSKYMPFI